MKLKPSKPKKNTTYRIVDRAIRLATTSALASLLVSLAGCAGSGSNPEDVATSESDLSAPSILGFESTSGWTVSSGTVSTTTTHTQGTNALAVKAPSSTTTLKSAALASSAAGLAALTNASSSIAVDLELPTSQPNPKSLGTLQITANAPDEKVSNVVLGSVTLTGEPLGVFQTYKFPVPSTLRSKLTGVAYSDLTFTITLSVPSKAEGTYVFDNMRALSPATQTVGAASSVELTALQTENPPLNTPGTATFTSGTVQIPSSFHVYAGSAGTGTATFALGFSSTPSVTCTYKASSDGTSYVFSSCTTSNVAGDIVAASQAKLTIVSASSSAALTKIKAQLAYDALGDQVGTKLVPAIPTFWGTTPTDINAISIAFANAQNAAPPTEARAVSLPVPDFAKRNGTGAPINIINGLPPPPNDPPFNYSGHMNQGGAFDAYWQLSGNLSFGTSGNDFTSLFTSTASIHTVLFGDDIDVADVTTTVNADNGTTTATGFVNPSTTGNLTVNIFGQTVENKTVNGAVPFGPYNLVHAQTKPAPPIPIWIFTIQFGVTAQIGVTTSGNLAFDGPTIVVTPSASVGATVTGGVSVGFASGGISATIQLLTVSLPLTASALWSVNTNPTVCAANLTYDINAKLNISTLGGNVALTASIGVCPFCFSDSFTIFSWTGVTLAQQQIFDLNATNQLTTLPQSLCNLPLQVLVASPVDGATFTAGLAGGGAATASRPPVDGAIVGATIPCADLTWTSSDPAFVPQTGCNPSLTFFTDGAQEVTVTAVDQFGETGSAVVPIQVISVTGPSVAIVTAANGAFCIGGTGPCPEPFNVNVSTGGANSDLFLVQFLDVNGNDLGADATAAANGQSTFSVQTTVGVPLGVPTIVLVQVVDLVTNQVSKPVQVSINSESLL